MGYITSSVHVVSLLLVNFFQILAITNRFEHEASPSRNFRRHIGTPTFSDWELGLREAVYQALLRERNLHPNLREHLYSAPLLGRQDSATPFGDIAILARGQLYSAPGGFQFLQDPYQNDCDGCHNPPLKCGRVLCENWRPQDHERLLALWSVKRIRHRDQAFGYRYELEYKITPMSVVASEPFVTRNGNFDYSVPGHTFIVKLDPRHSDLTFQGINPHADKVYRNSNPYRSEDHWSPHYGGPHFDAHYLPPPPPPVSDEYYDEDPRRPQDPNGYQNVLFGPPDLQTKKPTYAPTSTKPSKTEDDIDHQLFNNVIHTLSTKTSTTRNAPSSTSTTKTFENDLFPESQTTQQPTTKTSTRSTSYTTSQLSSPTTSTLSYKRTTKFQTPFLPTIPIQTSMGTTPVLQEIPSTTYRDNIPTTKPLFTPTMIRFPTTISDTSRTPLFTSERTRTTPTTRFSESTRYVKYSEPDPLYTTSTMVTPTLPTLTSKSYATRTTKQYKSTTRKFKTTENIDFDLFGDNKVASTTKKTSKKPERPKFSNVDEIGIEPGEQVITVVNPPTMIPRFKEDTTTIHVTESSKPSSSHKDEIDFSNTRQLPPNAEPYITIDLHPSTRNQQHSTSGVTLSTESSTVREFTSKATTQESTMADTTLSSESTRHYKHTKSSITSTKTAGTIKTTVPLTRKTTPITYKTVPSSKRGRTSLKSRTSTTPLTSTTTKHTTETLPPTSTSSSVRTTTPEMHTTILLTTLPTLKEQIFPTESTETTTDQETTHTAAPTLETTFSSATTDSEIGSKTYPSNLDLTSIGVAESTTHIFDISTSMDESSTLTSGAFETTTDLFKSSIQPTERSFTTTSMLPIPTTTLTTTKVTTPAAKTSRRTTASSTTTRLTRKPTRTSSTKATVGDFLADNAPKKQTTQFDDGNFELDIFGSPQEKQPVKSDKSKPKRPTSSKELDDIFGNQPDNKQSAQEGDDYVDQHTTHQSKIIYSNFYSPSTPTQPTTANSSSTKTTNHSSIKNKTEAESPTSQSYITSVSVEVNKKNKNTTPTDFLDFDDTELEPTRIASSQESSKNSKYKTHTDKEEFAGTPHTSLHTRGAQNNEEVDNNKIFDALTLSVVNHARSIDYLHSTNCSTKENKYKKKSTYRVRKLRRRN